MSIRRNRYPERDNRDRKQEAMNQLARREALLRAEEQSAAAVEMAKTARLRALRLAKEAMDRKAAGKVDACAPPAVAAPRKTATKRAARPAGISKLESR